MNDILTSEEKESGRRNKAKQAEKAMDRLQKQLLDARHTVARSLTAAENTADCLRTMVGKLMERDVVAELDSQQRVEGDRFRKAYKEFATSSEEHKSHRTAKVDKAQRKERQLAFDLEIALDCLDPGAPRYSEERQEASKEIDIAKQLVAEVEEIIEECHRVSEVALEYVATHLMKPKQLAIEAKPSSPHPVEDEAVEGGTATSTALVEHAPESTVQDAESVEEEDVDPLLSERGKHIAKRQLQLQHVADFYQHEITAAESVFTEVRRQRALARAQLAHDLELAKGAQAEMSGTIVPSGAEGVVDAAATTADGQDDNQGSEAKPAD